MKVLGTGLVTLLLALAIGCGPTGSETTKPQPSVATPAATATANTSNVARENFAKHCTACHGERGEAGIVKIENKTLRVPSLTKGHALEHTDERLVKQIAEGNDEMPPFKDKLTAEEINGLVRYIRTQFQGK